MTNIPSEPTGDAWKDRVLADFLRGPDPTSRRPGPYVAVDYTDYWTIYMIADYFGGDVPDDFPSSQGAVVVRDGAGFVQALLPADEGDDESAADVYADLQALNRYDATRKALADLLDMVEGFIDPMTLADNFGDAVAAAREALEE